MTLFVADITGLAHITDVSDATKSIFLLTELRPEVCGMMPRSITCEAFNTIVDPTIQAENNLHFEADCAHTWSEKDKTTNKVGVKQEKQH